MRRAGSLGRKMMNYAGSLVKVGVTTDEIDRKVHEMIIKEGAYPSPLGYPAFIKGGSNFPKSISTSVNEVLCHAIPDTRTLQNGDIITIDITVYKDGFHGDLAETFLVGEVDEDAKNLVNTARDALNKAIAIVRHNTPLNRIGDVISQHAEHCGFSVVPELTGHGIGNFFHGEPYIFHNRNNDPGYMESGMTFTIEPILTEGNPDYFVWDDYWTMSSRDCGWAAQFEQTILVTKQGVEVLTA